MLIPNVTISYKGTNESGGVLTAPAYVADLLRATWGQRLAELTTNPIPRAAPDAYREVSSVAEEELMWKAQFKAVFNAVYPDGLRRHVERLLLADAAARADEAKQINTPTVAHQSYLDAGCTTGQAIALQKAGYLTLADLPDEFLKVAEVPGIAPDFALKLIEAKSAPVAEARPRRARTKAQAADDGAVATLDPTE
jgi:SAM-dependent methyltransferase